MAVRNDGGSPHRDLLDYAWNYFQLHANQRLTTFNFYIALSSLVTTGLVASFHKDIRVPSLGIALGLLLIAITLIFWRLDRRNRDLVHNGEKALKLLEERLSNEIAGGDVLKLFANEEEETNDKHAARKGFKRLDPYTFSNCFHRVFWAFGFVGLVGFIIGLVEAELVPSLMDWLGLTDSTDKKG